MTKSTEPRLIPAIGDMQEAWQLYQMQGTNACVPWFLMTSYLYYQHDISLIPDARFDEMCHDMLQRWDEIEHPNKSLIRKEDLVAGTGYYLKEEDLPNIIKSSAIYLARHFGFLKAVKPRKAPKKRRKAKKA